jgi:hypothetical protein
MPEYLLWVLASAAVSASAPILGNALRMIRKHAADQIPRTQTQTIEVRVQRPDGSYETKARGRKTIAEIEQLADEVGGESSRELGDH